MSQVNTSGASRRRATGCTNCRTRHLKCVRYHEDDEACANCILSDLTCKSDGRVQFRHGGNPSVTVAGSNARREYNFDGDQPWLKTSVIFIDETIELQGIYGKEVGPPSSAQAQSSPEHRGTLQTYGSQDDGLFRNSEEQVLLYRPAISRLDSWKLPSIQSPNIAQNYAISPASSKRTPGSRSQLALDNSSTSLSSVRSNSCLPLSIHDVSSPHDVSSRWGLQNPQQALLMQHFIQVLASWFDLFDPHQHFALQVPDRAVICPTLQKAIFALSARHLSRFTTLDPFLADRYYEQCIEELIPMFKEPDAMLDEDLLCATVILRLLEELDVSLTGCDNQHHLRGIQVLVSAQELFAVTSGGLRQAAFWAGLHQEVFMAFVTQRAIAPVLSSHCNIDRSFIATDDRTWTCRILIHCAVILSFCYSHNQEQGQGQSQISSNASDDRQVEWQCLLDYTQGWHASCPTHFHPIFSSSATNGSIFPMTYYHLPVQLTGALYYHVCLILLALHSPALFPNSSAGTGKNRVQAMRQAAKALKVLDQDIRQHVRILCGIALCNRYLAPAMTMASTALTLCGEHFAEDVEEREQEALLDILVQNEAKNGWPTSAAQRHLKTIWNWQ